MAASDASGSANPGKRNRNANPAYACRTVKNNEPGRKCIVQSEKTWWEEWKDPIKYAIATKRHGYVTNEDKLECIMESKGKGLTIDWEPDEY